MTTMRLKRVRFHYEGFNEMRKDAGLAADIDARGHRMAEGAGGEPDFMVESELTGSRARTVVFTATIDGMRAEAEERRLTTAFNAGRG